MITVKKDAIKFKTPDGMQSSGVLANVGVVDNPLNYITTTAAGVFKSVTFPDGYCVEYEPKNLKSAEETTNIWNISEMFSGAKGLSKVKFIVKNKRRKANILGLFSGVTSLKVVDFSECDLVFSTVNNAFLNCTELEEIKGEIAFSSDITTFLNMFYNCKKLKEVRFAKETLIYSLNLSACSELSDASLQSIIDGLADFTEGTARTLTLQAKAKAKLTEEQISQITNKNWTIA